MKKLEKLAEILKQELGGHLKSINLAHGEITAVCDLPLLKDTLYQLRDNKLFDFNQLVDLCAVDYLLFGENDWETEAATEKGFSRAVEKQETKSFVFNHPRFAVVYHLLSTTKNHRLRLKVFVEESNLVVPSVIEIWKGANWLEREAYDLFGILFEGHPDLRRILTDYGFIGHPFRKDFPISGYVEMRYDASLQQVIYEPVDIVPRVLEPKVIRNDNRYINPNGSTGAPK